MAKYEVTHACGHVDTHNLIGPRRSREWKLSRLEEEFCRDCALEEQRRKNEEAAEANRADELPPLEGTEKQVLWAESIRREALNGLARFIDHKKYGDAIGQLIERLSAEIRASWWIDHRGMTALNTPWAHEGIMFDWLQAMKRAGVLSVGEPPSVVTVTPDEVKVEATVRPAEPRTETVAEIRQVGNLIEIDFPERREDFRKLVRFELGYSWSGKCWRRTISGVACPVEDRVVETAHRLLAAGFSIRLYDAELRRRAIEGGFTPEPKRVIYKRTSGEYAGWFAIGWPRDEDYYGAARALPGSRWDRPNVVVPAEQWEAVLGFAETYDFALSPGARELMEQSRGAQEAALVAPPIKPKRAPKGRQPSQTPPKLEVPVEVDIDDSLRDDDD